jgi:hypothetical protein
MLNMCFTNALQSPQKVAIHWRCDCICSKMQVKMDITAYKKNWSECNHFSCTYRGTDPPKTPKSTFFFVPESIKHTFP